MAETNPKVMAMIEAELAKDPSISNDELLAKAQKIDRSVSSLSARQFNARYPLQVKRRKDGPKPAKKKKRTTRKKAGAGTKKAAGARKTRAASSRKPGRKTAASGAKRGRGTAAAPASGGDREAVRKILLDYAKEVSAADSMTDMVDLVMDVDRYVDRVMKAAS